MSSVASVLKKLNEAYGSAFRNVDEAGTIKRLYLSSPQLNFIFGGGFGLGRIYEFSGPESGGKSTLSTYIGSEIQKNNDRPIVVYVDFEQGFDKQYANTLGLDTSDDKFIFLRPLSGEDGFMLIKELIHDLPIGLVVWDSLAATPSMAQIEDPNKACVSPDTEVDFYIEKDV